MRLAAFIIQRGGHAALAIIGTDRKEIRYVRYPLTTTFNITAYLGIIKANNAGG
jgi:hypothetical protein